jgi:hypothetical protein
MGINGDDVQKREEQFGTNYREPMKAKRCYVFLYEQLTDIMLIILIFAAIISLVLNIATSEPGEEATGKSHFSNLQTFLGAVDSS